MVMIKTAKENKILACHSVKKKMQAYSNFSILYISCCASGYTYFLISNKCKKPCLSRLNNSLPHLILTTRVKNSVLSNQTLWCEKDSRGVAEKKLKREQNQKSVKNS